MTPLNETFKREIEQILGAEADAFFAAMDDAPALALRLNPARAGAAEAAAAYVEGMVPWEARGRYLARGVKPGASIAHAAGAFYLQEASAMVSANVLQPVAGERILDLCAAPGGKSTQIAAALAGEGLLVANEPEPARAKALASNLERLGVRNAVVTNAYPDALARRWPEEFDAILCDAPCSGEGMFRREPESRDQWNPAAPAGCAKRQAEILDRAAEMLRPGGRLVYSTCTFNRTENEGSIRAFLNRHPDFVPEDFVLSGVGASEGGMIRVWPQRVRGDGHFAARLRKLGISESRLRARPAMDRDAAALIQRLESEVTSLPPQLKRRVARQGDCLYALPESCPDLSGVRVIAPGVQLLAIGRNHIEPAHALAMALDPDCALRRMELTDAEAMRYLAGEVLDCAESLRGWVLMLWRDMPLGWSKASNAQAKNHLPKALRRAAAASRR